MAGNHRAHAPAARLARRSVNRRSCEKREDTHYTSDPSTGRQSRGVRASPGSEGRRRHPVPQRRGARAAGAERRFRGRGLEERPRRPRSWGPPHESTGRHGAVPRERACDHGHRRLRRRTELQAPVDRRAGQHAWPGRAHRGSSRSPISRGGRCSTIRCYRQLVERGDPRESRPQDRDLPHRAIPPAGRGRARGPLPADRLRGRRRRGNSAFLFPGLPNETFNVFLGDFNLAWEIDIWGRIRRATESARADYLGAQAFRRGVLLTLVSDVAQAYFELLELDRELEIARLIDQDVPEHPRSVHPPVRGRRGIAARGVARRSGARARRRRRSRTSSARSSPRRTS